MRRNEMKWIKGNNNNNNSSQVKRRKILYCSLMIRIIHPTATATTVDIANFLFQASAAHQSATTEAIIIYKNHELKLKL